MRLPYASREMGGWAVRNLWTLSEIPHNIRTYLLDEGMEVSMTVPKTLSWTKTHVRCGTPDCDWGTPMPSFSEGRIGPMPSRIPAALYRAPWPGSKGRRTNLLVRPEDAYADTAASQQERVSLLMIRTKFRRLPSSQSPKRRITREGDNSHETSEGATVAV